MKVDYTELFNFMQQHGYTIEDLRKLAHLSYETIYKIYAGKPISDWDRQLLNRAFGSESVPKKPKNHRNNYGNRKPVEQYDLDGNFIARYDGVRIAGKVVNGDPTAIGRCAKGDRKTAFGYIWKYATENNKQ